jgi:hypothetical protein
MLDIFQTAVLANFGERHPPAIRADVSGQCVCGFHLVKWAPRPTYRKKRQPWLIALNQRPAPAVSIADNQTSVRPMRSATEIRHDRDFDGSNSRKSYPFDME